MHFAVNNIFFSQHTWDFAFKIAVYYVRFDLDWLEMIEIKELAVLYQKGESMSFSARYYFIEIYPYTL